ncbi:MAG: T9SS type A sorting domain-containing protein, partial [Bacteroidota bacterium]
DANFNNLYEPELGDYPVIRGDVCVTWMVHDSEDGELARAGIQMIHQAYTVESDSDVIESTLFLHTIIHNTNLNVYDLKVGLWADWDLGNAADDYAGCDPENNYFYAYNGDPVDEPVSYSQGFGEDLAAQGAIFLNSPMISHVAYQNIPSPIFGFPVLMFDYVNYINGLRKNGDPLPEFGSFPNPDYDQFLYYSPPQATDSLAFNEPLSVNPPGDRVCVAGADQGSIQALQRICVDYAYVHAWKVEEEQFSEVTELHNNMLEVKEYYDNQQYGCSETGVITGVDDDLLSRLELSLYPNPATSELNLSTENQAIYRIYSSTGQLVQEGQLQVGQNVLGIDGLSQGMYTLTLDSGISSRFIKQ